MTTKRSTGKTRNLSPQRIEQNPENPRLIFRQDEMDNLMFSIDRHGIQVPLAVYQDGDLFRLIDGERRWRCAKKLNLRTVPVLVQDKPTETRKPAPHVQHPCAAGTMGLFHNRLEADADHRAL